MKTSQIARGIVGALSLAGVMGAIGCGAVGPDGEYAETEIGSSQQAIGIASLNAPSASTPAVSGMTEAKSPGYFKIDANNVLVLGGFTNTGAGLRKVAKYNASTDNWTAMTDLPANEGRGDFAVVQFPGTTKVALIGGRLTDGGAPLTSILVYDYSGSGTVNKATGVLGSGRAKPQAVQCGSTKVLSIAGEITGSGVENKLEVISPAASPNFATVAALQDNFSTPRTITLATSRKEHGAIAFTAANQILVAGGENGLGAPATSVERFDMTNTTDCIVNSANTNASNHTTITSALPAARSRFAFAKVSPVVGSNPVVTYDAVVAGGLLALSSPLPTITFAYDLQTNAWISSASTTLPAIGTGRINPEVALDGAGNFIMVGGDSDNTGVSPTSVNLADIYTAGSPGSWATTPLLSTARQSHVVAFINGNYIATHGVQFSAGTPTFTGLDTPE